MKFCLFVLHLPTHFLPHYPKNYIATLGGKIFSLFDNLVGIQFLFNIFLASASCLQKIIVENIISAMNSKDLSDQVKINGRLCYQMYMYQTKH